jgi:hypothetical protein
MAKAEIAADSKREEGVDGTCLRIYEKRKLTGIRSFEFRMILSADFRETNEKGKAIAISKIKQTAEELRQKN